jgi:hypothetical protein
MEVNEEVEEDARTSTHAGRMSDDDGLRADPTQGHHVSPVALYARTWWEID